MYTEKVVCPSGMVCEVREMKVSDEDLLSSSRNKRSSKILSKLLDSVVVNIEDYSIYKPTKDGGIDWNEVLSSDRAFLLYRLSIISFGPEREIKYKCPHCNSTNKNIEIDITDIPHTNIKEEVKKKLENDEGFEIELPRSGKKVKFNLLRGKDETRIETLAKTQKNRISGSLLNYRISEVEGFSLGEKEMAIRNLSSMDAAYIRQKFNEYECGLEDEILLNCFACGEEIEVKVDYNADFFFPNMTRKTF